MSKNKEIKNYLETVLDSDMYILYAANSESYTNIVTLGYEIPLILTGSNGIYVFLPIKDISKAKDVVFEIRNELKLPTKGTYYFVFNEDNDYILDENFKTIKLNDIYSSFENLYSNLLRPAVELNRFDMNTIETLIEEPNLDKIDKDEIILDTGDSSFVRSIIDTRALEKINEYLSNYSNTQVGVDGYKVDEDGTEYVLKYDTSFRGSFKESFTGGDKKWFRVSGNDSNSMLLTMLLGGWFGLHKFKDGKYFQGIIYALTCGFCGVYYLLDIINLTIGCYFYKDVILGNDNGKPNFYAEKVFYKPINNKIKGFVFALISLAISFILLNTIYKYGYIFLLEKGTALICEIYEGFGQIQ